MMEMSLKEWREFLGARVQRLFLAAVLFGLFLFAVESSFVIVFQSFLTAIGLLPPEKILFSAWVPASLSGAIFVLICFGVFRGLAYMGKSYLGGVVNQAFIRFHREKILQIALPNAQEMDSAELINIYSERVPQVAGVVNLFSQMILTLSAASLFIVLGFRLAPKELALSLVLLALILLPLKLLSRYIQSLGEGITKNSETMTSILSVGLRNYFFLSIYNLINREVRRGMESIRAFEEAYRKFYFLYSARNAFPVMGGVVVVAVVSYVGITYWQTNPVKLVAFLYILLRLGQAASESSSIFAELKLQVASVGRLRDWHRRYGKLLPTPAQNTLLAAETGTSVPASVQLEASKIAFAYPGQPQVFQDISLQVKNGDLVLVTGPSGAGKSTLLSVLLGLRAPSGGRVRYNGQEINQARAWLANAVAYVGPEPYLLKGNVRENLLYGHPQPTAISEAQMWDALRAARLESEIRQLPGDLNAQLLEHTQLSTGQKQRLAMARALLRHPKLLILDEATANLDAQTEQLILQMLSERRQQMGMIVVSHKGSFASLATAQLQL